MNRELARALLIGAFSLFLRALLKIKVVISGVLNLDKPPGISSARALTRIKCLFPRDDRPKFGHAGTLDPFATGVLLVLVGKATKLCDTMMGQRKRYLATICLGATTPTLDPTSPAIELPNAPAIGRADVDQVLPHFVGTIQQTPPIFSALRINGRRMYELARRGDEVPVEPRPVTIYSLTVVSYEPPLLGIDVQCGKGTYIRSLARDIAQAVGTSGYLTALRRTAVGPYTVEQAVQLSDITAENLESLLIAGVPSAPSTPGAPSAGSGRI